MYIYTCRVCVHGEIMTTNHCKYCGAPAYLGYDKPTHMSPVYVCTANPQHIHTLCAEDCEVTHNAL